eukprot:2314354-Amphidinium_carterae.1
MKRIDIDFFKGLSPESVVPDRSHTQLPSASDSVIAKSGTSFQHMSALETQPSHYHSRPVNIIAYFRGCSWEDPNSSKPSTCYGKRQRKPWSQGSTRERVSGNGAHL